MFEQKLTDNEIIKALENLTYGGHSCVKCKHQVKKGDERCGIKGCNIARNALDLINRLKAKNKEFDEKIVMQMGAIDWQVKEINRLKAENELKTMDVESLTNERNALEEMVAEQQAEIERLEDAKNAYKDIVDTCEAGAIKEFAERLKVGKQAFPRADGVVHAVTISKIDDLLAEMVGDNNVQSSN